VNVFGKAGTTGAEFCKSLTGKKIMDAGQQGKYFWFVLLRSQRSKLRSVADTYAV
jgi:hypothetical protein